MERIESDNTISRILADISSISEKTRISNHRMREVFFDDSRQLSAGLRLRKGLNFDQFHSDVNNWLINNTGELTNENLSSRGKLVFKDISAPESHSSKTQFRISVARRG